MQISPLSNKRYTIKDTGTHELIFSSKGINNAETKMKKFLILSTPKYPEILEFRCNYDSLPVSFPDTNVNYLVTIYTEIEDIDFIADSIEYRYFRPPVPGKDSVQVLSYLAINNSATIFTDSFTTNLGLELEATAELQVRLFNKFDTLSAIRRSPIVFNNKVKFYTGLPPTIDSLFLSGGDSEITVGQMVQFVSLAYDQTVGGEIRKYTWDFGNNNYSNEKAPFYTFNKAGVVWVKLSVTDDEANTVTDSLSLTVNDKRVIPPKFVKFIVHNKTGPAPLTIRVDATAADSDGIVKKLIFSISDGRPAFEAITHPVTSLPFTIQQPGKYIIQAIALDDDLNSSSVNDTITVTR